MGAVVSCIQACLRAIGRTIMAVINGIGGIIMAIVNGIVSFLNIIVGAADLVGADTWELRVPFNGRKTQNESDGEGNK
ncbi:hypothetical protein P885DRAFT_76310 [Corynascus similis CBS 632.67]